VALQTKQGIVAAHADAIVRDTDKTSSASLDFDGDAIGLSIESIFNQFLDDTRRPFNDFARRDLIGDMIGKQADAIHFLKRF